MSNSTALVEVMKAQLPALKPICAEHGAFTVNELMNSFKLAIDSDSNLQGKSMESIAIAIKKAAMMRLLPLHSEGYLVPYGNVLNFQAGYRGVIKTAVADGVIRSAQCRLVSYDDDFEIGYEPETWIKHSPNPDIDLNEETIRGVYIRIVMADGSLRYEWMNKAAIERARQAGKSKNSPAWKFYGEMSKAKITHLAFKTIPSSPTMNIQLESMDDAPIEKEAKDVVVVGKSRAEAMVESMKKAETEPDPLDTDDIPY